MSAGLIAKAVDGDQAGLFSARWRSRADFDQKTPKPLRERRDRSHDTYLAVPIVVLSLKSVRELPKN